MAKKQLTCRVLVATTICGNLFKPNALVKGNEDILKPLVESKELSDHAADIAYCENELKIEVIDLNGSPETKPEE